MSYRYNGQQRFLRPRTKPTDSSETSVHTRPTTRRDIPHNCKFSCHSSSDPLNILFCNTHHLSRKFTEYVRTIFCIPRYIILTVCYISLQLINHFISWTCLPQTLRFLSQFSPPYKVYKRPQLCGIPAISLPLLIYCLSCHRYLTPIYIFYNLHNHSWLHTRHPFLCEHRNDMKMKYVLSVPSLRLMCLISPLFPGTATPCSTVPISLRNTGSRGHVTPVSFDVNIAPGNKGVHNRLQIILLVQ
jgi:hypothetical protein